MPDYHIAQVNIGRMLAPTDDPIMADFMNNLDRINALAESAPGFVWRLQTDEGNATALRVFEDDWLLINMSVWTDVEALYEYTFKTEHAQFVRRRREWFEKFDQHYFAMWWIEAGTEPTPADAKAALAHLDEHGPTPRAFTFKPRFTAEEMLRDQ